MEKEIKQKPMILYAKNEINTVPLKRLSKTEIDLFFYLCFRLNEKESEKVTLTFNEVKKILDFKPNDIERLSKLFLRTHQKLLEINFTVKDNNKLISFPIFYEFGIDKDNKYVSIQVHPRFQYVLNYFELGNFTKINLLEIISLRSDYSKKLYPILKQFESTGEVYLRDLKEWREILCIPEAYDYRLINRKILTPVVKELSKYFSNLKINAKANGRKVTHIGFTFKPLIKIKIKNTIHNEKKIEKQNFSKLKIKNNKKEKSILSAFSNKKTIINNDNNSWLNNCDND